MFFTSSIEPITVIRSIFIILAILMFRNFITHIILKLIRKLSEKYNLKNLALIIDSIEKPLLNLITCTSVYLGLIIFPFNSSVHIFINRVYRTFIIITVTQGILSIITAYSDVLNSHYLQSESKIQISKTVFPVLSKLIKAIVVIVAIVAIAMELNFKQLSSVLAGLGIGGAALALASQDLIKNFFGGIVILTDRSFNVGDWIKVDSFEGIVEELGLRSTKIRTFDKEIVIIPNSRFADREVVNFSARENRRVAFTLNVMYNTPPEKVKSLINKIKYMLDNNPKVVKDTALVRFSNLGTSSMEIFVLYLTVTKEYTEFMEIKNDINFKIIELFNEENVEFAYQSFNIYTK